MGGQGIAKFDTDLAPYVTKEYNYWTKVYNGDEKRAREATESAVFQAMEAFVYNMNTMRSRSGAQVTFSSVNFGTDTTPEARMISKNLLKAYIAGLGNGENPIFPNLCYRLMDGVNLHPGEPNFDITELAIECVGKRIQPRFVFCDSPAYPNKYDAATMGCVDGDEVIAYMYNGTFYCEGFKRLWERVSNDYGCAHWSSKSRYSTPVGLKIWDGENGFVDVKTVIENDDMGNWVQLTFNNGRTVTVTDDHPLYTENRGRIYVKNLNIGDTVKSYYTFPEAPYVEDSISIDKAYALGIIIADGNYSDRNPSATFDCYTEQDIISAFRVAVKKAWGKDTSVKEYRRGTKGDYDMVTILGKPSEMREYLTELFGGEAKVNRSIPSEIFTSPKEVQLAFLAGMIDADGHISHKSKVQIGSTNKELALQQLALAQSVGIPAKLYLNEYAPGRIRYRVEFSMNTSIASYMASAKKVKRQWNGIESATKTPDIIKVTKIEFLGNRGKNSYDVETTTDKFTLSFVRSGNCRTAVRENINGSQDPDARGNLAFSTINLPYLALEAKSNTDKFFEIFNEAIDDAVDELLDRYGIIADLKVKDVPFVGQWYQGHEGLALEDRIEPMVKNGSLSVGFIGLAECLIALTGKHHGESKESQEFGLKIVGLLRDKMDKAKKKHQLNFCCFATPAESLCYTALKAIRKDFGVIKGISDKEYLTNSCHLPVSFECDMKTKVDIEAPYHLLCNAGAIFYIEAPSSPKFNPQGLLKILQYIAKSGIVYGGINFEHDYCIDCGYQGTFSKCPKCGSKNIKVTKIITGYLSEITRFNAGKKAESKDRVRHV